MQVAAAYLPLSQDRPNRTGPAALTIAIHLLIGYGLATSMGIAPTPTFVPHTDVVDVPIAEKPPEPIETLTKNSDTLAYTVTIPGPQKPDVDVEEEHPPAKDQLVIQGGGSIIIDRVVIPQVVAPRLVRSMEPMYPSLSRIKEEEGVVHVRVTITPFGTIGEVQVEKSSGHPRLDDAALRAVREWRFAPAMRGKEAIIGSVIVPVRFELRRG